MAPMNFLLVRLVALGLFFLSATAQSSTASGGAASPSSSSTASIYAGNKKWQYYGCYNETTGIPGTGGARALAGGGEQTRSPSMTVESCFDICNAKGAVFAGLEYTSECFCSQYVNSLAAKLPDASCNLTCAGNSSQYCGGPLKLTVYTIRTTNEQKNGAAVRGMQDANVGSILALSIAMGMMLWIA